MIFFLSSWTPVPCRCFVIWLFLAEFIFPPQPAGTTCIPDTSSTHIQSRHRHSFPSVFLSILPRILSHPLPPSSRPHIFFPPLKLRFFFSYTSLLSALAFWFQNVKFSCLYYTFSFSWGKSYLTRTPPLTPPPPPHRPRHNASLHMQRQSDALVNTLFSQRDVITTPPPAPPHPHPSGTVFPSFVVY